MTDTNDKELLQMAAKAAGVEGEYESWTGQGFKEGIRQILNGAKCQRPWNPLTNDGDALRLAVTSFLNVAVSKIHERTIVCSLETSGVTIEEHEDDPGAATRRAITRAAAEIGRNMK